MNLYIHGTGLLSAAGNNGDHDFLKDPPGYHTDQLACREPDYSTYISPMQLRRMSKAVRMGIGAAKICLQHAGSDKPDALSVGTAMGCLQDTEVFLSKMIDQAEQMLTPTAFIQSTHNTVAGQIALLTGCHGHNLTFVQRGHSFEHACINAQLYLHDHPDEKILLGGIDELIDASKTIMQRAGVYAPEAMFPTDVLSGRHKGSLAGEGASFFLAGFHPGDKKGLCIKDILTFVSGDTAHALQLVQEFIAMQGLKANDIDAVLLGLNGDKRNADFYNYLQQQTFAGVSQVAFKHICGEYPTASAFGLGFACEAFTNGFPEYSLLNHKPMQVRRVMIINNFLGYYSCWYLEE